MPSKKTTKTNSTQTNSLPEWLTSPYQAAATSASTLAARPAISAGTNQALQGLTNSGNLIANTGSQALGTLSGMANGNFGNTALTGAANGDFVNSNIFAQNGRPTSTSSALNGYAVNGGAIDTSGALGGFANDGGLDTGYIGNSMLNRVAAGDFLDPSTNPYIKGVADRAGDSAQARINAQFGSAGRSNGSGLYAQLFGQGISNAANDVYYNNYSTERDRQQSAQGALLGAEQSAREAALGRQYGAASGIFGAENAANENAAGRQYGASTNIFGAENNSAESAASRQASAYEAERQRQQAASGNLLNAQLDATSSLPSIMSAILGGNTAALSAGEYGDKADLNQLQQYIGLLSGLSQPYGIQNTVGKTTETTGGLGATVGAIAQLGGAAGSLMGGGGLSSFFSPGAAAMSRNTPYLSQTLGGV